MRHTSTHLHRQDTDGESYDVKSRQGRPSALSEGRTSLTRRKGKKDRPNLKGVYFTKDEMIRMRTTLQIKVFIRGIIQNGSDARSEQRCNDISTKATSDEFVENSRDVTHDARPNNRKVHFATPMDLCHLKHAELAERSQKTEEEIPRRSKMLQLRVFRFGINEKRNHSDFLRTCFFYE